MNKEKDVLLKEELRKLFDLGSDYLKKRPVSPILGYEGHDQRAKDISLIVEIEKEILETEKYISRIESSSCLDKYEYKLANAVFTMKSIKRFFSEINDVDLKDFMFDYINKNCELYEHYFNEVIRLKQKHSIKIKDVYENFLLFDNGTKIELYCESDTAEEIKADFMYLKNVYGIYSELFPIDIENFIKPLNNFGFVVEGRESRIYVPCRLVFDQDDDHPSISYCELRIDKKREETIVIDLFGSYSRISTEEQERD